MFLARVYHTRHVHHQYIVYDQVYMRILKHYFDYKYPNVYQYLLDGIQGVCKHCSISLKQNPTFDT